jgi:hypothetical protein
LKDHVLRARNIDSIVVYANLVRLFDFNHSDWDLEAFRKVLKRRRELHQAVHSSSSFQSSILTIEIKPFPSHQSNPIITFKMKSFTVSVLALSLATVTAASNCTPGLDYCGSSLLKKGEYLAGSSSVII